MLEGGLGKSPSDMPTSPPSLLLLSTEKEWSEELGVGGMLGFGLSTW